MLTTRGKTPSSRIVGFRHMTPAERLEQVAATVGLDDHDRQVLATPGALSLAHANGMIENVVSTFELPLGIATNFLINGRDYLVPMAVEEPSVVAAASYMARIVRSCGGFTTSSTTPIMRAQVQVLRVSDPHGARLALLAARDKLIRLANEKDSVLVELGGGCQDIEVHVLSDSANRPMLVVHLLVDVRDAMGANTVNTMAEAVAAEIESITAGEVRLRILSNLADLRLARVRLEVDESALETPEFSGKRMISGIIDAYELARIDPYRAATHNKGIMNGIDPIVVATGNDWRAVEAGAHAYAARSGLYRSLSTWETNATGKLVGTMEMPMAVGLVGGATKTHPAAQAALKILKVQSATELAEVMVAVGLAQNMAALRALATEGIQRGHMALHARNTAIGAGALDGEIDLVAQQLVADHNVSTAYAKAVLANIRSNNPRRQ